MKSKAPNLFDEAEANDLPKPTWISKEPSEEFSSEIYTVTTESVLQKISTTYDLNAEKITNEISKGLCSVCGKPLSENNVAQCYCGSDLLCNVCTIDFNGRSICRNHFEIYAGSKEEATVLVMIALGLNKDNAKKVSGLSEKTLEAIKNMLANRHYIKTRSLGLVGNKIKLTEIGFEIINVLISAYYRDPDFNLFLQRIGVNRIGMETRAEQE